MRLPRGMSRASGQLSGLSPGLRIGGRRPRTSAGLPPVMPLAETTTALAAMAAAGATQNSRRQYQLDRLMQRLKAAGIVDLAQANPSRSGLWVLNQQGAAPRRINLLNPGTHDLSKFGTVDATDGLGFKPGSAADYYDTGIPHSAIVQDDVFFGKWGGDHSGGSTTSWDCGCADASWNGLALVTAGSAGYLIATVNGTEKLSTITGNWDGLGMMAVNRRSAAAFDTWHNSRVEETFTDPTTSTVVAANLLIGKVGTFGYSHNTTRAVCLLPGLTSAQAAELYAAVQDFCDKVRFGDIHEVPAGRGDTTVTVDYLVYAATLQGLTAAYRLASLGKSVAVCGAWREYAIGGMAANGLGWTDLNKEAAIGGLTRDLITKINTAQGFSDINLYFRPSYATQALRGMLDPARAGGQDVPIYWSTGIASVTKTGASITGLKTRDGRTFSFGHWLDCSFDAELARLGGVTVTHGREAAGTGAEAYNGDRGAATDGGSNSTGAQFTAAVDPYLTPGTPASGLIYGVDGSASSVGSADGRTQAYNYRLTLNLKGWRVPMPATPPSGYSAAKYEALARFVAAGSVTTVTDNVLKLDQLVSGVYDCNNYGGMSTDYLGPDGDATAYVTAMLAGDYATREAVVQNHQNWIKGLFYFLQHEADSRLTGIQASAQAWGFDPYHYLDPQYGDSLHWPAQMYVRESVRLVAEGGYIHDANDMGAVDGTTPRSTKTIGATAYQCDSHHNRRIVSGSSIWLEGEVNIASGGVDGISPIPLDAFVPQAADCDNGFVVCCPAMTHVGIGAYRLEFPMAQVADSLAQALVQAASNAQAVQDIDYATLRATILASGGAVRAPVLPQVN